MNVRDALREAVRLLESNGILSAQVVSEWTLAQVMRSNRFVLLADSARSLTEEQRRSFQAFCIRLARHEPLQYVLGTADFMGLTLKTDARALIPRPETEQLVDRVLHSELWYRAVPGCGVDVGTGSGCIVLALAEKHPGWCWTAVDHERDALALARENACSLLPDAAIEWRLGDLLDSFAESSLDLVVSNPPYIATSVCGMLSQEVRDFEPRTALDGGVDGLDLVRRLIEQAGRSLRPEGWIFLEIGHEQGQCVASLMARAGFSSVAVHRDLAGRDRIAEGKKI